MNSNQQALIKLQTELRSRIEKIDNDLHSRLTSAKFSDQVTEKQNDDVLLNLKNEASFELEQIDRALLKIQSNEYGACEKCHHPISAERLAALPFTAFCKNCAQ